MKNCAVESALDGAATVSFLGFLTDMTGRNCSVLQRKAERTSSVGRLLKSRREREEIETILWKETKKTGVSFFLFWRQWKASATSAAVESSLMYYAVPMHVIGPTPFSRFCAIGVFPVQTVILIHAPAYRATQFVALYWIENHGDTADGTYILAANSLLYDLFFPASSSSVILPPASTFRHCPQTPFPCLQLAPLLEYVKVTSLACLSHHI